MPLKFYSILLAVVALISPGCQTEGKLASPNNTLDEDQLSHAKVQSVSVSGSEQNYTFAVEILSPDTGCDQYADWWEVITEDSLLIYRRILAHSHVNEQPFVRSGGPIKVGPDQKVIVRAHMNNLGYGTDVLTGTSGSEFKSHQLDRSFARSLATQEPLPGDCPN